MPSAFPKLEAVASSGRSGRGLLQMYLEVDIRQGPFPGHFSDQMDVLRFQEQAGESEQGSASDADAADMLDMRSFNLYERSSRPHAYDNQVFQRSGIFGSEAVGQKFIGLGCRQAV